MPASMTRTSPESVPTIISAFHVGNETGNAAEKENSRPMCIQRDYNAL